MRGQSNLTSEEGFENGEVAKAMAEVKGLTSARRHDEARALCTATLERFPDHADVYFRRGMIQNILKETQAAIADVSRAIELRSDEPAYRFFRGLWRLELGLNDDAIVDLSEAVRLEEALSSSYYVDSARLALAIAWVRNGDADRALSSISGLPDDAGVYVAKRHWSTTMLKEEIGRNRGR